MYIHHNRKLNITLNFRFRMYGKSINFGKLFCILQGYLSRPCSTRKTVMNKENVLRPLKAAFPRVLALLQLAVTLYLSRRRRAKCHFAVGLLGESEMVKN